MINKNNIVALVAKKTNFLQKEVKEVIDALVDTIVDVTKEGEVINIAGFGKFEAVQKAAREGVNPATGAKMTIAARKAPRFKPAQAYKDAVNS